MIKCPHPWMAQMVATDNHHTPCCMRLINDDKRWQIDEHYSLGIDSPLYKEARSLLRENKWPKICGVCERAENKGLKSWREKAITKFEKGHVSDSIKIEPLEIDYESDPQIKSLDIKFTNTCNLACRMCSPWNSSEIEKEMRKYGLNSAGLGTTKPPVGYLWDEEAKKKVEYTKNLMENGLQYFKVTGGEPFACKYFMEVLTWAVEKGYSKNIVIFFTTNATKFNKKILELLKNYKAVSVNISVDGVEKTYDYIRHKSSWSKLNTAIDVYQKYRYDYPKIFGKPNVSCVLQAYNIFDLCDLSDWCTERDFIFYIDSNIHPEDHEMNVAYLPKYLTEEAVSELNLTYWHRNANVMINTVKDIFKFSKENVAKNVELLNATLMYDKARNQNYRDFLDFRLVKFLDDLQT